MATDNTQDDDIDGEFKIDRAFRLIAPELVQHLQDRVAAKSHDVLSQALLVLNRALLARAAEAHGLSAELAELRGELARTKVRRA